MRYAETIAQRTTRNGSICSGAGDTGSPLSSPASLFDDPHLRAVDFFETVDHSPRPVRFPVCRPWFPNAGRVAGPPPNWVHIPRRLDELGWSRGRRRRMTRPRVLEDDFGAAELSDWDHERGQRRIGTTTAPAAICQAR
ncbi:hypothetical protein BZL30_9486 [Mycobacterium kansasii]|uniref:Uncharacterized protein n=1 Tax=Mycobacterium kansasii TaxID=1768 RepID=A0A1V3W8X3_MYCKA|nr:hypothetical protein BZL30_9486 [Mycobacterium kansasii]